MEEFLKIRFFYVGIPDLEIFDFSALSYHLEDVPALCHGDSRCRLFSGIVQCHDALIRCDVNDLEIPFPDCKG